METGKMETTTTGMPSTRDNTSAARLDGNPPIATSTDAPNPKEGDLNTEYVEGFKLFSVLLGTTIVYFLILLDTSILSTAVPRIATEFHSLQDVGWYGSAYQLSSAALQPLTGKLYTYFSGKWMFLFCVFVFELGSLLCAVSTSSTFFIVGRAVAGMGGAGISNGAISVISGAVPLHKRPLYQGIMLAFGQLGIVVGPLIGGALTQYTTWRWCFYINLPIGAVAAVFLFLTRAPEPIVKPAFSRALVRSVLPRLDLAGLALLAPAVVMFQLALQYGGSSSGAHAHAWGSSAVVGLLVGAAAAAGAFVLWERSRRSRGPDDDDDDAQQLIPFSMVRVRVVWTSTVQFAALMVVTFVAGQYLPLYFQSVEGASPAESGVWLLPSILSSVVLVVLSGALVTRFGSYLPWAVVAGVAATLAGGLFSTWSPATGAGKRFGYQIVYGVRGAGAQASMIAVQNALPPRQSQLGIAFLIFCQGLTASVFLIVANVIFTETLTEQIARLAPSVDPAAALAAGGSASGVRALLAAGSPELAGLLKAYAIAFDDVCYLMLAAGFASFLAAWGMDWIDVRKEKENKESEVIPCLGDIK
ncbi:putative MFS multidrug transporter [Xylariaceae sp. FL0804]|nr:putative MFS multidrug transporter [Xylariaceae sp. FL0804]